MLVADGIIEAAEGMGSRFLLGVQWHPEWLAHTHDSAKRLFVAFADACRVRSLMYTVRPNRRERTPTPWM